MRTSENIRRKLILTGGFSTVLLATFVLLTIASSDLRAYFPWPWRHYCDSHPCGHNYEPGVEEVGGTWYWLRSPEDEKRVVIGLYNRYCIRCHGIDGRGVWDIPDVPN